MRALARALFLTASVCACSGAEITKPGAAVTKDKAAEAAPGVTTEPEIERTMPAQSVTGSFLVGCGPVTSSVSELNAGGGEIYGCSLYTSDGKARAQGVKDVALTLKFKNGDSTAPKFVASTDGDWDVYIVLPPGSFADIDAVSATATVAGVAVKAAESPLVKVPPATNQAQDAAAADGTMTTLAPPAGASGNVAGGSAAVDQGHVTYLFVTSAIYHGSALSVGNAYCVSEAFGHLLPGATAYKAVLSTAAVSAASILGTAPGSEVRNPIGHGFELLAANPAALLASGPASGGLRHSDGTIVAANELVWTGSAAGGSRSDNCNGWTDGAGVAAVGAPAGGAAWIGNGTASSCTAAYRMYCAAVVSNP